MSERPGLPTSLLDAAVELLGRDGRGGVLPVSGTSMLPSLRPGQSIAVAFDPGRPALGDVLVFRQDDYIVVHRLLYRRRGADGAEILRTRGDGRVGLDPPVRPESVLGMVVAARDDGGWWDLRGRRARLWGLAVAAHDLCWTVAGYVTDRLTGILGPWARRLRLRDGVFAVDRGLLHACHALLFRAFHRRIEPPDFVPAAAVGGPGAGGAPRGSSG